MKFSLIALAALAQYCSADVYAQFCDDNACSENCGISVDVTNPGCLANEFGRNSVKFHDNGFIGQALIFSPGSSCDCQDDYINDAYDQADSNGCLNLNGHAAAQSYRFIQGDASANNC